MKNKFLKCVVLGGTLIVGLSGCTNKEVVPESVDHVSGTVESIGDVITWYDCEGHRVEQDGVYLPKYYILGRVGDVDITSQEREKIFECLTYSAIFLTSEFKNVSEIPLNDAVFFAYHMECFKQAGKTGSLFDKYNDITESIEEQKIDLPINFVKDLLKEYFDNSDLSAYKGYDEGFDFSRDYFAINGDRVILAYITFYPEHQLNNLEFSNDGDVYTVTTSFTKDAGEVESDFLGDRQEVPEDETDVYLRDYYKEDHKFDRREYTLVKREDGSIYLTSMKVLEKGDLSDQK